LYLTSSLTDKVRHDILSWISRVPVPAEFGAAEVPRRKMDEVGYMRFHGASFSEAIAAILYVSSLNIFIWGVTLCCHAACKNFAGLFAARFVLGICEGSFMAGFMIVSAMFYTRRENTTRVGYCCEDYD
jgi:MFS family permease